MKLYTYMYCRLKSRKKGEQLYSIESDCLYTLYSMLIYYCGSCRMVGSGFGCIVEPCQNHGWTTRITVEGSKRSKIFISSLQRGFSYLCLYHYTAVIKIKATLCLNCYFADYATEIANFHSTPSKVNHIMLWVWVVLRCRGQGCGSGSACIRIHFASWIRIKKGKVIK